MTFIVRHHRSPDLTLTPSYFLSVGSRYDGIHSLASNRLASLGKKEILAGAFYRGARPASFDSVSMISHPPSSNLLPSRHRHTITRISS